MKNQLAASMKLTNVRMGSDFEKFIAICQKMRQ
jgi:hypothetical protein